MIYGAEGQNKGGAGTTSLLTRRVKLDFLLGTFTKVLREQGILIGQWNISTYFITVRIQNDDN